MKEEVKLLCRIYLRPEFENTCLVEVMAAENMMSLLMSVKGVQRDEKDTHAWSVGIKYSSLIPHIKYLLITKATI